MPDVTIVATTWLPPGLEKERLMDFQIAVYSWYKHLKLSSGKIHLHLADDGTTEEWFNVLKLEAQNTWSLKGDAKVTFSQQRRKGVGASLNAGIDIAKRTSPFFFYAVDDWELLTDLDLTRWVSVMEDPSIGQIRFFSHPDLTGKIVFLDGLWAIQIDRHHFAFAHRPALYHTRMIEAYGKFDEMVNAYECEQFYNERYCKESGPRIIMALPDQWKHLGSVELAHITPGAI